MTRWRVGFDANATYALSNIGEEAKEAVPALMQALQDEDISVSATGAPEALKTVKEYESR